MTENRYQPPRARLQRRNREPGPILRAIAVGALIDIGGTMLAGFLIGFLYAIFLGAQGRSAAEIQAALSQPDPWSLLGILLLAAGLSMSVLGGYRCAAIANRNNYLAPGLLSLISVGFGALISDGQTEQQQLMLFSALTVAAILGGASMYVRKLAETPPGSAAQ